MYRIAPSNQDVKNGNANGSFSISLSKSLSPFRFYYIFDNTVVKYSKFKFKKFTEIIWTRNHHR